MAKSARRQQLETVALYPLDWVEERSGLVGYTKWFLFRKVPRDISWAQTLGAASLTAFIVQAVTGVFLAMYYKPDPDNAYASVQNITEDVTLGWLVRGMHKWGASIFIILMFFHMARTFLFGAYKYPRELNWVIGVLILVLGMLEGFTGYLLPWDNTAYWATVVGINLNATAPFAGPFLAQFLQGGLDINPDTLAKFYALHMLLVPAGIMALIGLHLYLVVRLGVTSPPWSATAAGRERSEVGGPREGLIRDPDPGAPRRPRVRRAPDGRPAEGAEPRGAQALQGGRRGEGKSFFPYAMLHDTVMSLVVVAVIIALAVHLEVHGGRRPRPGCSGRCTRRRRIPARRASSRGPDWYFYFLFYLLRIFKWPETVVLGTVGVPTIS